MSMRKVAAIHIELSPLYGVARRVFKISTVSEAAVSKAWSERRSRCRRRQRDSPPSWSVSVRGMSKWLEKQKAGNGEIRR